MDMLGELGAAEHSLHWLAVAQDVKIVCGEVDETLSDHARNRAAANVPFHRHMPVEHRGPGFDFMDLQINVPGNDRQGLPDPRTGETSVDRKQLLDQAMQVERRRFVRSRKFFCVRHPDPVGAYHSLRSTSSGQAASLSDNTDTGSGHTIPIVGSS